MADEVVNSAPVQSDEVVAPEVAAVPTDNEADVTTWKKRLAGKDQALTATKKELDEIRSRADELAKWKAEQEQAQGQRQRKHDVSAHTTAPCRIARFQSISGFGFGRGQYGRISSVKQLGN